MDLEFCYAEKIPAFKFIDKSLELWLMGNFKKKKKISYKECLKAEESFTLVFMVKQSRCLPKRKFVHISI